MTIEPISDERLAEVRKRFDAITTSEPGSLTGDVKALLARLDKAEAGWQPIETVPWWDDVLFYDPEYRNDHRKVFEGYCDLDRGLLLSAKGEPVSPTHWRPLPPNPTA